MKKIYYEAVLWISAVARLIPGRLGCFCRRHILPFKSGKRVYIWEGCQIDYPSRLHIGDDVSINRNTTIHAGGHITIGSNVLIGPNVTIYSQNHNYLNPTIPIRLQGYSYKPVIIEDDVWIAANVTILPGVKIGEGSVIAAGSIVTHDTEPYGVYAGAPARLIKRRR